MAGCLPFHVEERYRCFAWFCVIGLYSVPGAYVAWRSYQIAFHEAPSLKTTTSSTWGNLPRFVVCSPTVAPKNTFIKLLGFKRVSETKAGAQEPREEYGHAWLHFRQTGALSAAVEAGQGLHTTEKIPSYHFYAPQAFKGPFAKSKEMKCLELDTSMWRPLGTIQHPSFVDLVFVLPRSNTPMMHLYVADFEANPPVQWLALLNAGETTAYLNKVKAGSMRLKGKAINSLKTWTEFLAPEFKDVYSTELVSYSPDKSLDKIMHNNHTELGQVFKVLLRIPTQHVPEQLEIGRLPQILFLVANVGGFLSVITCILGVCWVRKNPHEPFVKSYEEKTLLVAAGPEQREWWMWSHFHLAGCRQPGQFISLILLFATMPWQMP